MKIAKKSATAVDEKKRICFKSKRRGSKDIILHENYEVVTREIGTTNREAMKRVVERELRAEVDDLK